jgi:hypothetical protein
VIASITEIAAATIENARQARLGTALEEGLERTRTTDGIPFTAEGHWFRADSTRLCSVRQGAARRQGSHRGTTPLTTRLRANLPAVVSCAMRGILVQTGAEQPFGKSICWPTTPPGGFPLP